MYTSPSLFFPCKCLFTSSHTHTRSFSQAIYSERQTNIPFSRYLKFKSHISLGKEQIIAAGYYLHRNATTETRNHSLFGEIVARPSIEHTHTPFSMEYVGEHFLRPSRSKKAKMFTLIWWPRIICRANKPNYFKVSLPSENRIGEVKWKDWSYKNYSLCTCLLWIG